MALFSIITITYNNKEELKQTINTTLNQSFQEFELIIINGAPRDETTSYLQTLNDVRIKYISEQDNGIYDAMNKGLQAAQNEYVIFMNSGDTFYSKNTLMSIAKEIDLNKKKPLFIYGNAYELDVSKSIHYKKSRHVNLRIFGMFAHHQAMLYSNKVIVDTGNKFNTEYKITADYDFTMNFIQNINLNDCLKINLPICVFSLNGISTKKAWYGFYEQFIVKKKYYFWLIAFLVLILQYIVLTIRVYLPLFYGAYRYNSKKNHLK